MTRGNGVVGDDVTANARTIRRCPWSSRGLPARIEVRGEVYMARSVFAEVNRKRREAGEPEFANPRNATAGSIRLLDPRQTARRGLRLWCYQVAEVEGWSLDDPLRGAGADRRARLAGDPRLGALQRARRGEASPRRLGLDPREPRLRHRRRGGQGGRRRGAGGARRDRPGGALGGGLQVPAGGAHHPGAGHRRPGRPDRGADPGRGARAGGGGGLDREPGHAAQLRRARAPRRPRRRHGVGRQGGRGHPEGGRGGERRAPRGGVGVPAAGAVPGLRDGGRA